MGGIHLNNKDIDLSTSVEMTGGLARVTAFGQLLSDDAYGIIPVMNNIAARSSAFVVRRAWVLNQVQDDMSEGLS